MHAAFRGKIKMSSQEFQNFVPCNENGLYLLGQQELTQFMRALCAKMLSF